ncbi:hypothetical protein SAMN06265379_1033 [Saccharicrinis carchari]|uniref:Uncharacterized protein n=1 Tax=Saccharicrinis carchari TaxID=1168039 RepID=A0A521CEE4_SACCC|nr:hypothetical protein SAMN06265379_1033 [Saccharicrinis carchari]
MEPGIKILIRVFIRSTPFHKYVQKAKLKGKNLESQTFSFTTLKMDGP